jgi:hypothetical protein
MPALVYPVIYDRGMDRAFGPRRWAGYEPRAFHPSGQRTPAGNPVTCKTDRYQRDMHSGRKNNDEIQASFPFDKLRVRMTASKGNESGTSSLDSRLEFIGFADQVDG